MPRVPTALSGSAQTHALFLGRRPRCVRGPSGAAVQPLAAGAALQVPSPLGAAGKEAGVALERDTLAALGGQVAHAAEARLAVPGAHTAACGHHKAN